MKWSDPIRKKLDALISSKKDTKPIAVFDADGTLWHGDLGESFFKYQIENNLVPGLRNIKDPWGHYRDLCLQSHESAYGWLAQIIKGTPEKALQKQTHDYYWQHFHQNLNAVIRDLIAELKTAGFDIWVCSASIKWALEPAMKDLNLPLEHLIAVEVSVEKGLLTEDVVEPVPYKLGKRYWLEKKLPTQPLLVAGNSLGDMEMLKWAKDLPLVVIYKPHLPAIKESEEALMKEATQRGWSLQIFQVSAQKGSDARREGESD